MSKFKFIKPRIGWVNGVAFAIGILFDTEYLNGKNSGNYNTITFTIVMLVIQIDINLVSIKQN